MTNTYMVTGSPTTFMDVEIGGGPEVEIAIDGWIVFSAIACYLLTGALLKQTDYKKRIVCIGLFCLVLLCIIFLGSNIQRAVARTLYLLTHPDVTGVGIWVKFSPLPSLVADIYSIIVRLLIRAVRQSPFRQNVIKYGAIALFVLVLLAPSPIGINTSRSLLCRLCNAQRFQTYLLGIKLPDETLEGTPPMYLSNHTNHLWFVWYEQNVFLGRTKEKVEEKPFFQVVGVIHEIDKTYNSPVCLEYWERYLVAMDNMEEVKMIFYEIKQQYPEIVDESWKSP